MTAALAFYRRSFTDRHEAEDVARIRARLADMIKRREDGELEARYGDRVFHVLAGKIGEEMTLYSQFTTLPIGEDKGPVVAYEQYFAGGPAIGLHEIARDDALARGRSGEVLGTISEGRMRTAHCGRAIWVETTDGRRLSPYLQPALARDTAPQELMLFFQTAEPRDELPVPLARALVNAVHDNFAVEGFDLEAIAEARAFAAERFLLAKRVVLD